VRYILFWEFCPEDMDKAIAKNKLQAEIMQKEPERFGETLFPPQYMGYCKGFTLSESNPEQVRNSNVFWFPELKLKFVPCDDVANWIEAYMKTKK
jgi:hypothetical protein